MDRHRIARLAAAVPAALMLLTALAAPAAADTIICVYVNNYWIACI